MGVAAVPFDPTGGAGMNAASFARENALMRAAMQGPSGFNMQIGPSSDESMKMLQLMLPLILAQSQQDESGRQFDEMMGLRRDEAKRARKSDRLDRRLATNQMDLAKRQQEMAESLQDFQLSTARENRTIGERTAALGALPLFFQGEQGRFDENLARAEQRVKDDASRTVTDYQTGFAEAARAAQPLTGLIEKLDSDDYDRNEVQRILQAAANNLSETLGQFTSSGMNPAQAEGVAAAIQQQKQALKFAVNNVSDEADRSRFRDAVSSIFDSGALRTFTQENYHPGFLPGIDTSVREKIGHLYSAASEERNMGRQTQARILESLLTAKDPSQIGDALGLARGFDMKDDVLTGLPFGPQPSTGPTGGVPRETIVELQKALEEAPRLVPEQSGGVFGGAKARSGLGSAVEGVMSIGPPIAREAQRTVQDFPGLTSFPRINSIVDRILESGFYGGGMRKLAEPAVLPPAPPMPAVIPGSQEDEYLRMLANTGFGQPLRSR